MPELGSKFECTECGTKFYDLGNPGALCPKCGSAPGRDSGEPERRSAPARAVAPAASSDDDDAPEIEDGGDDAADDLDDDVEDDDDDEE